MASNASVIDPSVAPSIVKTELQLQPARSLDTRPLSTRYQEYCPNAPEYSAEEEPDLVASMVEVERQLASSTHYDNQEEIALQQDYNHLKLDHAIALRAYESFEPDDPEAVTPANTLKEADDALVTFEAAYPEAVLASVSLYGKDPLATEPASTVDMNTSPVETETSTQVVLTEPLPISESPTIPDGQPQQSHPESLSFVDTPSPQVGDETTDSAGSIVKAGSLKPAAGLGTNIRHNKGFPAARTNAPPPLYQE